MMLFDFRVILYCPRMIGSRMIIYDSKVISMTSGRISTTPGQGYPTIGISYISDELEKPSEIRLRTIGLLNIGYKKKWYKKLPRLASSWKMLRSDALAQGECYVKRSKILWDYLYLYFKAVLKIPLLHTFLFESRCFRFVHMTEEEGANEAIEDLNGYDLHGRKMKVGNHSLPADCRDM